MAKRKVSASPRKPARGTNQRRPAGEGLKPATARAAGPAVPAPSGAAPASRRPVWWSAAIVALIALIGLEVFVTLKNNIKHQWKVTAVRYYGLRGEAPDQIGKFWGANRLRLDETRKRLCLLDGMFNKLLYFDLQTGVHVADVDKSGKRGAGSRAVSSTEFAPASLDLDSQGNTYVIDRAHAEVDIFSPDFKLIRTWKTAVSDMIAVTPAGSVFVLDAAAGEIIAYSADGKELKRFGRDVFSNPRKMVADETGTIYVLDQGRKCVDSFSPEGKRLATIHPRIQPFGDCDFTVSEGKIYVCMYEQNRLFVYSVKGDLEGESVLPYPGAISVNGGVLYIAGPGGLSSCRMEKKR